MSELATGVTGARDALGKMMDSAEGGVKTSTTAPNNVLKGSKVLSLASVRLIKLLIMILTFIALAEFFAYFFVLPMFSRPEIEFIGNKQLSREILLDVVNTRVSGSWLGFSKKAVLEALNKVSGIAQVEVHKTSPGHIAVYVSERVPTAITTIDEDGHTSLVCVDRDGVLFRTREASKLSLPLISGLPIERVEGNVRVPLIYRELFTNIEMLLSLNPACFSPISEIRVQPKKYGNYELVLYPVKGRTKLYIDRFLTQAAWQYVLVTLDVAQSMSPPPEYIDLRYGAVSFKP